VLQIEKVFCGELEVSTEPYTKAISTKEKEREKSKSTVVSEFKKLVEAPNVQSRFLLCFIFYIFSSFKLVDLDWIYLIFFFLLLLLLIE